MEVRKEITIIFFRKQDAKQTINIIKFVFPQFLPNQSIHSRLLCGFRTNSAVIQSSFLWLQNYHVMLKDAFIFPL